ncbi:MAG: hypothetical protein JMDDDDMK_05726 [Acidobacteria bacterium]|nr:hypothetical protein [Acidobacteriota bacterium]
MGDSGEADAGGGDFGWINLRPPAGFGDRLFDVIDGGVHSYANVVCGIGSPLADNVARAINDNRATIGSTSINPQPEMRLIKLINRLRLCGNIFKSYNAHKWNLPCESRAWGDAPIPTGHSKSYSLTPFS